MYLYAPIHTVYILFDDIGKLLKCSNVVISLFTQDFEDTRIKTFSKKVFAFLVHGVNSLDRKLNSFSTKY